ncbi:ricin-type beta-trefoil lectin domain protein [Streptomyces sp. NPDC090073]|uniref:ricin-type beta-trefoil lectin domain protein n=1 Tax=Streptomyces sp. NPDC090073 TaxID=3365936 RepID=UPI003829B7D1
MQSPHPPRPPYPPLPGSTGESDRHLIAQLAGPHVARHHAVALLLARHWRAAADYAVVCLTSAGPTAQLVATASFHEVLGRMTGGPVGGALRPQLLVAVRDSVRAWATDESACATLPELRRTAGGRGLSATKPGTPERRQLAERAFQALPGASQCLLWHTEVEAEPINIPAGLLGIDGPTARAALEQAREQFRTGCVRAHRELAPSRECRFYNRLLDVPIRRGGALLPEVRRHLAGCGHCRYAAEQFAHFDGRLGVLLAETVLGWGARRYLDSRPGHAAAVGTERRAEADRPVSGGRHRTRPHHRHRTAMAVGVGLTALALLATVLVTRSWSDDNGVPGRGTARHSPVGGTPRSTGPGTGARSAGSSSAASAGSAGSTGSATSAASVGESAEVAHGRLRGLASGLCLDVRGDGPGTGVRLAPCSAATSQQWSYRVGGLLRSAADPARCLAADPAGRRVVLDGCGERAAATPFDITVRGEILLREHRGLVLTPGRGGAATRVGIAARNGSPAQRWLLDTGAPGPSHSGGGEPSSPAPQGRSSQPAERAGGRAPEGRTGAATPRVVPEAEGGGPEYGAPAPRIAQAGAEDRRRPSVGAGVPGVAGDLVASVSGLPASLVARRPTPLFPGAAVPAVLGSPTG